MRIGLPALLADIAASQRTDAPYLDTPPCTCHSALRPRDVQTAALGSLRAFLAPLVSVGPKVEEITREDGWRSLFAPVTKLTEHALAGDAWLTLDVKWLTLFARTVEELSGQCNRFTRVSVDCSTINALMLVWEARGGDRAAATCQPLDTCAP